MADKVNATLKVYYLFNETKCLARGGTVSASPVAPGADVATVDLRNCALAVCSASPELIGDKSIDYSIYTLDATEGIDGDLYEGQGLLSWGLSQPQRLTKVVSGFIKPSLSGTVLEVRMKLCQVAQSSQQDFITSMQSFERISKTLPATFDYSNWTEFMKHATSNIPSQSSLATKVQRNPSNPQTTTLQKARELVARQTPHSMSAQLKSARQQQSAQQRHARMIAQQAAATQAIGNHNTLQNQQRRVESTEGEGPLPDPASPALPTPSSPPQMKTFPPPPATSLRSNSMPSVPLVDRAYNMPQLTKFTSTGTPDTVIEPGNRGTKRKAAEISSSTAKPTPALSKIADFSPTKAINAAKNSIGAVQQLFKARSPALNNTANSSTPSTTVLDKLQQIRAASNNGFHVASDLSEMKMELENATSLAAGSASILQRNDAELLKALEYGQPIKFCYNCGNIQTRGNWRQLEVEGQKHNLCNACGVYWKTKNKMRPEKLWNKTTKEMVKSEFPGVLPSSSNIAGIDVSRQTTPPSSDICQYDAGIIRTSPSRPKDHQSFQERARATRSSPVTSHTHPTQKARFPALMRDAPRTNLTEALSGNLPTTPSRERLHELHINTPQPPPSPSPASGNGLEDLVALLQTPKKSFTSAKVMSSPSPWRSMFTLLDEVTKDGAESPSRQKLDKFLEDLGMSNGIGSLNFDINAITNFPLSPAAQQNLDSLASFMSSPPGMGIFTSSAGMDNEIPTPEDNDPPLSARKLRGTSKTPQKKGSAYSEEGDSLFTPKKSKTKSQPGSIQRNLRSASSAFGEQMFGGELK